MALDTLIKPPVITGEKSTGLCNAQPLEAMKVCGVSHIANDVDIILFSAHNTLFKDGMILPTGAVAVPSLRKSGKKLAVFTLESSITKDDLTQQVNHVGLSFAREKVLLLKDFDELESRFPFYTPERILFVCSDVLNEVSFGLANGFKTLLITDDNDDTMARLGISSHYVANSV